MDTNRARILYLAVADGRGHLMRAHLLRGLLAGRGLEVDIVTTAEEGCAFLARLGTPARLLSEGFAVEFDDRHRMLPRRTEARLARYLTSPRGVGADLRRLKTLARGCALLVNDSLHPAALALPALGGRVPVVNVFGENLWRAAVANFDGRLPGFVADGYVRLLEAAEARAHGRIVHSLAAGDRAGALEGPTRFRLPPLTAAPLRSRAEVRRALGVGAGERLAAVYLNPHFRDPEIAVRLEAALAAEGVRLYGISERWAGRPGWRAADAAFSDVVAASDVFISGGGAAALELARVTGVALLALTGDQPEQGRNLEQRGAAAGHLRVVSVDAAAGLRDAIAGLVRAAPPPPDGAGARECARIEQLWIAAFTSLVRPTTKEPSHDSDSHVARRRPDPGDQQPARRVRRIDAGGEGALATCLSACAGRHVPWRRSTRWW